MRTPFAAWISLGLITQCASLNARELPPLPAVHQAPIAVFASRFKAVVTESGDLIIKPTTTDPDGLTLSDFRGIRAYVPFKGMNSLRNGARLRLGLEDHSIDSARITQQYTNDPTPVVQTDYEWSDAHLKLRAFAAEPEYSGFYVIGELTSKAKKKNVMPSIEACLENVGAGRILEASIVVDEVGQEVLRTAQVNDAVETRAALMNPGSAKKTCLGVPFSLRTNSVGPLHAEFAIQLPVNSGIAGEFSSPLQSAEAALNSTNLVWLRHLEGGMTIEVPDARLQSAWEANIKQLGVMLEPQADGLRIVKGLDQYRESTAYDTFQGSLILDLLGYDDLAEALLRRQMKRIRPDGVFEMSDQESPPTRLPDQWIVQGLAPLGVWKHYEITRDRRWLEEVWPTVLRSAKATVRALRKPSANGTQGGVNIAALMPPSVGDGGIGYGYVLPQNYGPLAGIWIAREIARVLGAQEQDWLTTEHEQFKSDIVKVMQSSIVSEGGYKIVSPFPGAVPEEATKHLWGTIVAVYPFAEFAPNDSLVLPTLRFIQSKRRNGLHLNLGYSSGVWPYMSAAVAHWHMRLREFDEAFNIQMAILDYASPNFGWFEEIEDNPPRGYIDNPDVWGTCELLTLTRELLLLEQDHTLLISPAIPTSWMTEGRNVAIKNAPTLFGEVSYRLSWTKSTAHANISFKNLRNLDKLSIRLVPAEGTPQIKAEGATVASINGRFTELTNVSPEVSVTLKW